ncbi:MAG: prolipoprotein diacylglyceryl transferase [Bacteroidia bacterium]|nr:prolipoprotein diacylglyceryl transferase [Bacteroidia bacterium]
MNFLLATVWDVDPEIFTLGPLTVRWYGPLFAGGFLIGYFIVRKIFLQEKAPEEWLDKLLVYLVVATVVGARLGHVFFYGWEYYKDHLLEIPMIWKGGLASHGGLIGLMVTFWLYAKRVSKKSVFWAMDRVAPQVALAGTMIRLGNLFNSEILGKATESSYGMKFVLVDGPMAPARHPAQLYESLAYLAIFGIMSYLFWKTSLRWRKGAISGILLILIFTARLIIENFKEEQADMATGFVAQMLEVMTMGQWLSIPAILLGTSFLVYSFLVEPEPIPKGLS